MHYRLIDRQTLYQGFFRLDKYSVAHERFDGGELTGQWECLERGDAVAVVLYDSRRDKVLLIEQFRVGPLARDDQPWLIEIVAGMLDGDEKPELCARRECIEEAGYEPLSLQPLGVFYVSPGGTSERIFMYLGETDCDRPVTGGGGLKHEDEDIRVFWVSRSEALNMVRQGRIQSAAPMLALLLAFAGDRCKVANPA